MKQSALVAHARPQRSEDGHERASASESSSRARSGMSVRHGLLALLERGARYGYQLRSEFERATGGTWPMKIGQVYTTLSRLDRDGLVRALPNNDGGQRPYEITPGGRTELALWFASPV